MKKLIVVVGPPRSGTRFMAYLISLVQGVNGMNAYKHNEGAQDLDIVWKHLREDRFDEALSSFLSIVPPEGHVLTRRCYPHGSHWANLKQMQGITKKAGYELVVIVLTRDITVIAQSMCRVVANSSLNTGLNRVKEAYKVIFEQIKEIGIDYSIFNYETLIALGENYLKDIVVHAGLEPVFTKEIEPLLEDGNSKYIKSSNAPTEFTNPKLYPKYITENPEV